MNRLKHCGKRLGALALLWLPALSAHACAACYGKSDSAMAQGMNWGIFSLLAVVGVVLGCVGAFFVFIGCRSTATGRMVAESSEQKVEE